MHINVNKSYHLSYLLSCEKPSCVIFIFIFICPFIQTFCTKGGKNQEKLEKSLPTRSPALYKFCGNSIISIRIFSIHPNPAIVILYFYFLFLLGDKEVKGKEKEIWKIKKNYN